MDPKAFSALVSKTRRKQGLSMLKLGEMVESALGGHRSPGALNSWIQRIERGKVREFRPSVVSAFCKVLDITDPQLLEAEQKPALVDQKRDILPIIRRIAESGMPGPVTLEQFHALVRAWHQLEDAGLRLSDIQGEEK